MSILSFRKKIFVLSALSLVSFMQLNAETLNFKAETKVINKKLNKELNGYLGKYTSVISNFLGVKLNMTCLIPAIKFNKKINFSLCNLKDHYKFKIGPCSLKVNLSSNPLYSRINNMCSTLEKGISVKSLINVGFLDMSASVALGKNVDFSKIKYVKNITYKELYGDKKGKTSSLFITITKKYPNSSIAKDVLTNNKKALIVEDHLIKSTGSANLSSAILPKNKAIFNKAVVNNAKVYKQTIPDIVNIISNVQKVLTSDYVLSDIRNSDGTYNYVEYLNDFQRYVKGDLPISNQNTISKLYQTVNSAIDYEYANKLLILEANSKYYEYAPTADALKIMPLQKRKKFLFNSLIWTAQKTDLLGQRDIAKAKADMKIKITLRKAYIASKPFDAVRAQKELNALLQITSNNSGGKTNKAISAIKHAL